METKICSLCGIGKPLTEFNKGTKCKECWKIYMKQYYLTHKDKINKQNRDYHHRHKDELYSKRKDYYKERYQNNRDYILTQQSEYREKNSEKRKETMKRYCETHKEQIRAYAINNADKIKAYKKEYNKLNEDAIREKKKKYYQDNREEWLEKTSLYAKTHRKQINKRIAERKENDSLYKLKEQCRRLIFKAFSRKGYTKKSKSTDILGCDYDTFINHLLKTYKDNYGEDWDGIEKIHIDHIIPLSTAKNENEVIKLNHYTNLQLLKEKDNIEKSDNVDWTLNEE